MSSKNKNYSIRGKKALVNSKVLYVLCVLLLIFVGFVVYRVYRSNKALNNPIITSMPEPVKKTGEISNSQTPSQPSNSPKQPTTGSSSSNNATGPKQPYGTFISNYQPGGKYPTTEESICNTTPGAQCYITLTKGGYTKKLEAKTADSSGVVVWDWDVKKAGLSAGSWQVTAVATLNGKTASTRSSTYLVVTP